MDSKSSLSPTAESVPVLHIGRAYNARDAAAILGLSEGVLNLRVREGTVAPMFPTGDRRYSGYELARLLGWPLSEDPRDYVPSEKGPEEVGVRPVSRRRRRLGSRQLKAA